MIRLAVRVRRAQAELVLAELLELTPAGVEESDLGDCVEYAIYGPPGELPALPALEAAAGGALVEVATSEVPDDWSERWRRFHGPVLVGDRLLVRPPWCRPDPAGSPPGAAAVEVVIDPGQAFGTGAHATTRLCLELLLTLVPGGPFLDVGCGSGVLAIAAAALGWAPVLAVDNDPASVAATRRNARLNGVEVEVRRLDLRRKGPPAAPTVAANLVRGLLLDLAGALPDPPPRHLIGGGLLVGEVDEVAGAFARRGLRELARRAAGDWGALLLAGADAAPAAAGAVRPPAAG